MLTARSASVIADVLNGPAPVRLRDLSTRYDISERTAKYDIQQVREWLAERGLTLRMNATDGFHIECPARQRTALLEEAYGAEVESSIEDRTLTIAVSLARATSPTSINQVAKQLGVARNTVLAALPAVDSTLREAGIRLCRNRSGLSVTAPVSVRRLAVVHMLRNAMRNEDVVTCARYIAAGGRERRGHLLPTLWDLADEVEAADQIAADVRRLTLQIAERYDVDVSDSIVVGVYLRLLTVIVIPSGPATAVPRPSATQELLARIDARDAVLRWTSTDTDVDFALFELGLRISSEQLTGQDHYAQPFDVGLVARTLINKVDRLLEVPLARDGALLPSLINHLSDRLAKIHHGILEPNPVLEDVVARFPQLHDAVQRSVHAIFRPAGLELDETDCAYLTVHFATAQQRIQDRPRYRALLVCGTGRGTTELVRSVVETQMPDVDVVATCAVFTAVQDASRRDIDLVISTFPFTTEKPLAVIRPLPTGEDLKIIAARISEIASARPDLGRGQESRGVVAHPLTSARTGRSYEEMILLGFDLTREIQDAIGVQLREQALDGLRMHCLFLARRIANGELYTTDFGASAEPTGIEQDIDAAFSSRDVSLPGSELAAIAEYFRQENLS